MEGELLSCDTSRSRDGEGEGDLERRLEADPLESDPTTDWCDWDTRELELTALEEGK